MTEGGHHTQLGVSFVFGLSVESDALTAEVFPHMVDSVIVFHR